MKRALIAIALALASATAAAGSTPIPAEFNKLNSLFWKGGCASTIFWHDDGGFRNRPCWGTIKVWVTSDTMDLSGEFDWMDDGGPRELDILFSWPMEPGWGNMNETAIVRGDGRTGDISMFNSGNAFNWSLDDYPGYGWVFNSENSQGSIVTWLGNFDSSFQYIDNGFHSGVHVPGPVQMPEPGSIALLGLGLFGLAAVRIKRRRLDVE